MERISPNPTAPRRLQSREPPHPEGRRDCQASRRRKGVRPLRPVEPPSHWRLFESVLLSPDPDGVLEWLPPDQTYLDIPFLTTGFSALYKREK